MDANIVRAMQALHVRVTALENHSVHATEQNDINGLLSENLALAHIRIARLQTENEAMAKRIAELEQQKGIEVEREIKKEVKDEAHGS